MAAAHDLTIAEAGVALRDGSLSAVALTEAVLARIEATEPALNAYITVTAEIARAQAAAAQAELRAGRDRGPLQGIPFAYKDLFDTAGVRTTAGSTYLAERVPEADAAVVARLREAGVVLTGKLGLSNYFGSTSVEPPFGAIRNPWNPDYEPGSSSGGSGAATAAGSCLASLGTDSGGSVRTPASLSGVCGLKPTFGLVPTRGVLAMAWTLDTVGILARSAEDVALVLNAIAGGGVEDPAGEAAAGEDYTRLLGGGLAGVRVGVPRDALWQDVDEEVAAACEAALEVLREEGAALRKVSLPLLTAAPNFTEWAVGTAETSANCLELIGRAPPDLPPALSLGLEVSAVEYINAQRQRRLVMEELREAFMSVDVLVSPTNSIAAPRAMRVGEGDEIRRRLSRLPSRYNVTGSPALSVPCGFTEAGLPIGLSIAGGSFAEATVLRVAAGYQRVTEWHRRRPGLSGG